jgi:glycine/D-amino acid oxidase-like deaminating enzyme
MPRRHIVNTPRGSISCSYIIHATNAYASQLLPHFTGPNGIIPNRAQVVALRAAVSRDKLGMAGWSANEGFEYWFPMSAKYDGGKDETEWNPLIILGGGREVTAPHFEIYEDDDSVLNEKVSRALKDFLPSLFEGRYEKGREPEMEWVCLLFDLGFCSLN